MTSPSIEPQSYRQAPASDVPDDVEPRLYTPVPGPSRKRLRPRQVLLAIQLGAGAVAVWPLALALQAPQPLQLAPLLAHVAGMLAGFGVVVLLALMSRAPALERGVGADVLARWHGKGGRVVVGLVLVHAWAAVLAWQQSRQENALVALGQVLGLPGLVATSLGTLLLLSVAAGSIRAARRRLSYESWHSLHLITYLAVALTFLHQLAGPDLAGHRVMQVGWSLLYTFVFALLLRYRVLAPLQQAARHRLRVRSVVAEGHGVVSIEVEGEHLDELQAEAGQFFRWRFLTPDTWLTAHPFSLSAPPTKDRLRLTVKALGTGSAQLQSVAVGTWVVAEGPYGAMTAARRTQRHVLLIAGGVGITPMRALFETLPLAAGQDLTLLYRARTLDDVPFRGELEAIARDRGARVRYLLGIDPDCLTAGGLLAEIPDLTDRDVYLCGSLRMADAVRAAVLEAGLPPERLHEERFAF
ncbi:Ferredoxin-NADP reductase [Friedmanniella luteola]|uniref:Ferredoxin-NADP reductase n=1 Tax=Friedmanniella luteola TaxID=546871 RepID=A0A1H1LBB8_9ACTN|nr:ferric reductase-like transmembrane domain-containing protein [Friedmanniella luteola]SDR71169.1 Ferredoxin-NADP reductase [Friedmanniella luteola]